MAIQDAQTPQAGPTVHPSESELETRAVVRHLLAGCEVCRALTRRLWRFGDDRPGERRTRLDLEGEERMKEIELAQEEIREIVRELKRLRLRLSRVVESLPPEASPLADADPADPRTEIRSTVECVLEDSFDPAIRDLERVVGNA